MKIVSKLTIGLYILAAPCLASQLDNSNDYFSNSYEENKVAFKIKPGLLMPVETDQQQGLPASTTDIAKTTPRAISNLLAYGGGIEVGATVFFNDYIASELSLGTQIYQVNSAALKDVGYNYSTSAQYTAQQKLYNFPATATIQLHIAPYGGIRPYVGLGATGVLFYNSSIDFAVNNTVGGVMQAGIDFYFRDETSIGLEVKKYLAINPTVRYQTSMLGQEIAGKLNLNPWVISLNIGLTF